MRSLLLVRNLTALNRVWWKSHSSTVPMVAAVDRFATTSVICFKPLLKFVRWCTSQDLPMNLHFFTTVLTTMTMHSPAGIEEQKKKIHWNDALYQRGCTLPGA